MKQSNKDNITPYQVASSSLLSYIGMQYPKYRAEPMHELIASALEAVEAGRIRRLLISAPPQHGKPCWEEEPVLMRDGSYKKLKDVCVGDYVITHKRRPRKVLKVYKQGYLPTIQLNTRSGRNPCSAKDHPFLTISGWVEAGKLNVNDSLAIVRKSDVEYHSNQEANSPYYLPDTITSIKNTGKQKCRCLLVEEDRSFTIQNIVVHNTMLTSEFFPPWVIGRHPDWKIISATYNQERANEVGAVVRDQFKGSIHRAVFPNCTVSPDIKSSKHVATEQRGHYYSIGLSSTGTGRGSNIFLVDDPFKGREDAESKIARAKVKEWYKAVLYTRLRPDGSIIIINTRWHLDDLTGHVLNEYPFENWTIIELKAVAEENDILGRKVGEAICPSMYTRKMLDNIKAVQKSYNWESLYQQQPIVREGGIIKYDWLNYYTELPPEEEIIKVVVSWDTAQKEDELHDPTAGTVWVVAKNGYYLIDVCNKKMEFPTLVKKVKELHENHNPTPSAHLIEDRGSGTSLIQHLKRETTIPVIEISTKNLSKAIRLDAVSGQFESGKVYLPTTAHWLEETKDQLCLFPSYGPDDITDSVSQFLNWVANKTRYVRRPPNKLYWK